MPNEFKPSRGRPKGARTPFSQGNARRAAVLRLRHLTVMQVPKTYRECMRRIKDQRKKDYIKARVNGMSQSDAYVATVNPEAAKLSTEQITDVAKKFEISDIPIRTAIRLKDGSLLRGSTMSLQERAQYVLDRLLLESIEASRDSARLKALELLGKTVPELFRESAPSDALSQREVDEKLKALLDKVRGRVIQGEAVTIPEAAQQSTNKPE